MMKIIESITDVINWIAWLDVAIYISTHAHIMYPVLGLRECYACPRVGKLFAFQWILICNISQCFNIVCTGMCPTNISILCLRKGSIAECYIGRGEYGIFLVWEFCFFLGCFFKSFCVWKFLSMLNSVAHTQPFKSFKFLTGRIPFTYDRFKSIFKFSPVSHFQMFENSTFHCKSSPGLFERSSHKWAPCDTRRGHPSTTSFVDLLITIWARFCLKTVYIIRIQQQTVNCT